MSKRSEGLLKVLVKSYWISTGFGCPGFRVEAWRLWGSRCGVYVVVPNIQNGLVRMKFPKSASRTHLWWWRPTLLFAENPKAVQLSNIPEMFWGVVRVNALSCWHWFRLRHEKPEFLCEKPLITWRMVLSFRCWSTHLTFPTTPIMKSSTIPSPKRLFLNKIFWSKRIDRSSLLAITTWELERLPRKFMKIAACNNHACRKPKRTSWFHYPKHCFCKFVGGNALNVQHWLFSRHERNRSVVGMLLISRWQCEQGVGFIVVIRHCGLQQAQFQKTKHTTRFLEVVRANALITQNWLPLRHGNAEVSLENSKK